MIGSANIHYIESVTFRPLKNLKYLRLWNNPGLLFPMNIVQWSSELNVLNLVASRLNLFDFRVLNFLPKLEELEENKVQRNNYSKGISNGEIESLVLKSCGIRNITSDMFEPLCNTSLLYLGLPVNRLPVYPT